MAVPPNPGNPARILVVAGPTCSGKSALATHLAQTLNGTVINADSMQIYRELRVITARPTPPEEALVPHRLYGVRPASEAGSAAWWRTEALAAIAEAHAADRLPILCGGTGLYFAALTQGLADIPDPGAAARAEARTLLATIGAEALHARLTMHDPTTAARLAPADGQRLARAWEVYRGTGKGLAAWQAQTPQPPELPGPVRAIVLDPPRAPLRAAIASRFQTMVDQGALREVQALVRLGLDPSLPAMRAHGVPELTAYLRGETTLDHAIARATLVTGQYTKRQATWFRHHAVAPETLIVAQPWLSEQFSQQKMADMQNFILGGVDALHHHP